MDQIEVEVGQTWADNDPRGIRRKVTIQAIEEITDPFSHRKVAYAHCIQWRADGKPGRKTRIRLDRFRATSNGYTLVSVGGKH